MINSLPTATLKSVIGASFIAVMAVIAGCATPPVAQGDSGAPAGQIEPVQRTVKISKRPYKLYFLGGQSNMEGFGFARELPEDWLGPVDRVRIFAGKTARDNELNGGIGIWDDLQPGFGTRFFTDGKINILHGRFGPELTFGRRLSELEPESKIAIIKFSRGGSSLHADASGYGTWEPDFEAGAGINQYDNALTTIRNALSHRDIDNDGKEDDLVPAGIIWMQGESDAQFSPASAEAYEENLKRIMDLLRAALRVDDLPVVIGKITDSGRYTGKTKMKHIETVQAAQRDYARTDSCAAVVTVTDDFEYLPDGWHYLSDGYVRLGNAFAEAVVALSSRCAPGNIPALAQ